MKYLFTEDYEPTNYDVDDILREVFTREHVNAEDLALYSNDEDYIEHYSNLHD